MSLSLDTRDFYIKYIVKSKYWYFSDYLEVPGNEVIDVLDRFKEIVSEHFHISFHSLQLVGSAKTGFSLSPNKILTPFHDGDDTQKSSDIDIAIISESLYQYYWNKMRQTEKIQYKRFYQQLTASIFRGYINDKVLMEIPPIRTEWISVVAPINKLLQDELMIVHPITYRIYRSWEDLEEYQIIGIEKTKKIWRVKMFSFSDNHKSIKEINTMFSCGSLIVDESYQRRSVWGEKDKIRLIETILLKLVIPEVFFWEAETDPETGESVTHIVDGQQRIKAISSFIDNDYKLKSQYLLDEEIKEKYDNKFFKDLDPEVKTAFWNYRLMIIEISQESTKEEIVQVFRGLNLTDFNLNDQEKRNSISGDFAALARDLSWRR